MWLFCMLDMQVIGKCYLFENIFKIGFDDDGNMLGVDIIVNGICGYFLDLFDVIVDCVMFYVDNVYQLGVIVIIGNWLKIYMVFYIVFCGFGGL